MCDSRVCTSLLESAVLKWVNELRSGLRKPSVHHEFNKALSVSNSEDINAILERYLLTLLKTPIESFLHIKEIGQVINGCFDNVPHVSNVILRLFPHSIQFFNSCLDFVIVLSEQRGQVGDVIHLLSRVITLVLKQQTKYGVQEIHKSKCTLWDLSKKIGTIATEMQNYLSVETMTNFASSIWLIRYFTLTSLQFNDFYEELTICIKNNSDCFNRQKLMHVLVLVNSIVNTSPVISIHESHTNVYLTFLIDICQRHSSDTALILLATRSLQGFVKEEKFRNFLKSNAANNNTITELISVVWMMLEHPVVFVRHSGRDLISLLCVQKELQMPILNSALNLPRDSKTFLTSLVSLAPNMETEKILKNDPKIPENLVSFFNDSTVISHFRKMCEIYEIFLILNNQVFIAYLIVLKITFALKNLALNDRRIYSKNLIGDWCNLWICPIIKKLPESSGIVVADATKLLHTLFKAKPEALNYCINKWKTGNELYSLLICLKICNRISFINEELKNQLIGQCLMHNDDEIRITALSLLIESVKPTQIFTHTDLQLILTFLHYNLNNHKPAIRQKMYALIKQMLIRLVASAKNATVSEYELFAKKLIKFCYENLISGGNFNRTNTVLIILKTCKEYKFGLNELHNPCYWTQIIVGLENSFEENKVLTVDLAMDFPFENMTDCINDDEIIEKELNRAINLIESLEPPSVLFGTYYSKILIHVPKAGPVLEQLNSNELFDINFEQRDKDTNLLCLLNILFNRLKLQIADAKSNLLSMPISSPLYGLLFAIRLLLPNCSESAIQKLLHLSLQVHSIVGEVVNNASPEGHLPMDLLQHSLTMLQIKVNKDVSARTITAQALLLCCWRSAKESSLLLADLAKLIDPKEENANALEMITKIGERLIELLCEIKHRGAFEQAFYAFTVLCNILLKSNCVQFSKLPENWLSQVLEQIQMSPGQQTMRFCATRRSAGLPFLVQAIVVSEISSTGQQQNLHNTIATLLECASSKTNHLEQRVHSLNILRALFKHALLGPYVSQYIAQALIIAIEGSRSLAFPERNCCNLLFSALIIRIFGVARSRDVLSHKNKMTVRTFFQRFRQLYEFFLQEMSQATFKNSINEGVSPRPSLFLVLLIFSRLDVSCSPSSLTFNENEPDLTPFINYLQICIRNEIYQIRVLAARALAHIQIQQDHLTTHNLNCLQAQLQNTNFYLTKATQNAIHGHLLEIFYILKETEPISYLEIWISNTKCIIEPSSKFCYYVQKTWLDILKLIWKKNQHDFGSTILSAISNKETKNDLLNEAGKTIFQVLHTILELDIHCEKALLLHDYSSINRKLEDIFNDRHKREIGITFLYRIFVLNEINSSTASFIDQEIEEMICITNVKKLKEVLKTDGIYNLILDHCNKEKTLNLKKMLALTLGYIENPISWRSLFHLEALWSTSYEAYEEMNMKIKNQNRKMTLLALDKLCEEESELRIFAAKFIGQFLSENDNYDDLIDFSLLKYYILLLTLICDEDEVVRLEALLAANKVLGQSNLISSVMLPLVGQEKLLDDYISKISHRINDEEAATTNLQNGLFRMALLSLVPPSPVAPYEESGVFERGNPNPFYEPVALTALITRKMKATSLNVPFIKFSLDENIGKIGLDFDNNFTTINDCMMHISQALTTTKLTLLHHHKIFYTQLQLLM